MGLSPIRRAFTILLVAALAVAVLLLLAQDQEVLKIRSAYPVDDPRSSAYLASLAGADLTHGNTYDVLTNGDQFFPAMLDAINGARRRISFETYIYDTAGIANEFTAAFEKAARRGVRVNIVVDGIGGSMDDEQVSRLRNAGCHVAKFNAPRWYALEALNYRTHRKLMVIDGEVAFTGGAGIKDHWLGHAQDRDHWRDTQVRMRGPIARLVEAAFYENFVEAGSEEPPQLDDEVSAEKGGAPSFIVRGWSSGGSSDLKRAYLLAIASARKTIDVASPYFLTDESTRWSLQDAVKRGVKIRLLVEGDVTDAMPVKYASREAYDDLLQLGIEIHEYQPTFMHAKVLVIDGVWSMFGSANFDNRSLELNDELNVAVTSPALAARFMQDFEQDLRVSKKLELHTWRQRSLLQKVRERLWAAFGEIF
jgi:cardiolipin synthase A/B